MLPSLHSWLLSKWLAVFVLTVLVTPGLLEQNPGAGPSNEETVQCRKKRLVAICGKCDFRAQTEVMLLLVQNFNFQRCFIKDVCT